MKGCGTTRGRRNNHENDKKYINNKVKKKGKVKLSL
jgi:hypothetical protein